MYIAPNSFANMTRDQNTKEQFNLDAKLLTRTHDIYLDMFAFKSSSGKIDAFERDWITKGNFDRSIWLLRVNVILVATVRWRKSTTAVIVLSREVALDFGDTLVGFHQSLAQQSLYDRTKLWAMHKLQHK